MNCGLASVALPPRRLPRKPATGRTIRLRAIERLARDVLRRRESGPFTYRHFAALLGDTDDQASKDLTSIMSRRDDLGWDRIVVVAEAMDVDPETLFAPVTIGRTQL